MELDRRNSSSQKNSGANSPNLLLTSKRSGEIVNFVKLAAIRSGQNSSFKTFKFTSYKQ